MLLFVAADRLQRRINDSTEKYQSSEKERNQLRDQLDDSNCRNENLTKEIRNMVPKKEYNNTIEGLKK